MLDKTQPAKPLVSIEYVHDVVCSWCPIGLQNIFRAIDVLGDQIDFEIRFLPYELNPEMAPEGERIDAYLRRRNGWNRAQFEDYADMVVQKAANVGLTYDYNKRTRYYNTGKAHRLIDLAEQSERQVALVHALTLGYFRDGVDISDTDSLIEIAAAVGLDQDMASATLEEDQPSAKLREKYRRVRSLEIKSVPSMLIDGRRFVQGSHSPEFFTRLFSDLTQAQSVSAARQRE